MERIKEVIGKLKSEIRCKYCAGKDVVKKGYRKNKREKAPKYYCKDCERYFAARRMLNKSYPAKAILSAISSYNKGMTLEEASKEVNRRFHIKTYPKLISVWLQEFSEICTFRRLRKSIRDRGKKSGFADPVIEKLVEHKQPYMYKFHRLKIKMFLSDYYNGLRDYLLNVNNICPHEIFLRDNLRGSQIKVNYGNVRVERRQNYACKLAGLALTMAKTNRGRHQIVQDFMLANDASTIACEVPVWLDDGEVRKLSSEFDVFNGMESSITGHIDAVQARFGIIYVLDYKPGAEKTDAVSQLFTYAMALSVRTGVWLRNFRCAWFDDEGYYEFNPNEIILSGRIPKEYRRKFVLDEKAKHYFTSHRFHRLKVRKKQLVVDEMAEDMRKGRKKGRKKEMVWKRGQMKKAENVTNFS